MCEKYDVNASDPVMIAKKSKEFLVDDKNKLVMCVVAKNAGKTWKKVFNVLAGYYNSTAEQLDPVKAVTDARRISRLSSYKPEKIDHILRNYTLFMFSRHPLTRTLSAYRNLLSPNATERKRNLWSTGHYMIRRYRPLTKSKNKSVSNVYDLTFSEFVRYLSDKTVRYRDNNHWIEVSRFCHPCVIPYTVIGRYETLLDDSKYILKLAKVYDKVGFPESEGSRGTSTNSSEVQKLIQFYRQIPIGDFLKLIKRYELDYILFNYTLPTVDGLSKWLGFDSFA